MCDVLGSSVEALDPTAPCTPCGPVTTPRHTRCDLPLASLSPRSGRVRTLDAASDAASCLRVVTAGQPQVAWPNPPSQLRPAASSAAFARSWARAFGRDLIGVVRTRAALRQTASPRKARDAVVGNAPTPSQCWIRSVLRSPDRQCERSSIVVADSRSRADGRSASKVGPTTDARPLACTSGDPQDRANPALARVGALRPTASRVSRRAGLIAKPARPDDPIKSRPKGARPGTGEAAEEAAGRS